MRRRVGALAALLFAIAALAVAAVALVGKDSDTEPDAATPSAGTPSATVSPDPQATAAAPTGEGLAVGITEQNAAFLHPAPHPVPAAFSPWRDALTEIAPAYYRLIVNWAALQPARDAPPDLDRVETGCLRDRRPCAPYGGVREQLRALAARQKAGGWRVLVVVLWTPEWAAQGQRGCERPGATPQARPPRGQALPQYRALVRALLDAAAEEGADLRWWSPWNEPNHPGFISPQRMRCDASAPTAAVKPYVGLARALRQELEAAPGDQELALGELAGLVTRTAGRTGVGEFIRALPADLVCASDVWTQHAYAGGDDPVDAVDAALRSHDCPRTPAIWITETGAFKAGCTALERRLRRWHADPRVGAAFQYTLREDDLFPTGLVRTDLSAARPALGLWQAWGREQRPQPADPPPDGSNCRLRPAA